MFAKQTAWSASLVAVWGAATIARAEGDVHVPAPGDGEALVTEQPKPPTGTFVLGAGFSSIEGFIASASISQDDLFGTGNHLSLHARVSAKRQLFLARFLDPDLLGTQLGLGVDLYNDLRRRPTFDRGAAGGALTLSYPIVGNLRAFAGYRVERVTVEPRQGIAARAEEPVSIATGGIVSALRTGLVYDTRDRRDAPLTGTNIGASIEVADPRWGSELSFTRTHAWAEHHQPIGHVTLHLTGSVSTIAGPGGAPPSERLFLDTAHEIRGYSPLAFGPVDGLGRPVGADAKLLGSAELEVPLARRIGLSGIAFVDAGGLMTSDGSAARGLSAGFGLLWRSPIGALRFSWAFPVDGGGPAFVFGVGAPW